MDRVRCLNSFKIPEVSKNIESDYRDFISLLISLINTKHQSGKSDSGGGEIHTPFFNPVMDKLTAKSLARNEEMEDVETENTHHVEEVEDKMSRTFNMEEEAERATWGGRFFLLPLS